MTTPGTAEHGLRLIPFHGLRYVPERVGSLSAVTSPPYDVVVRPDGVDHLESADPHNIVRLILPQADTPAARNEQAARTLRAWLDKGVLSADPEPALYVYEQRRAGVLQRGIIGALALSDAAAGIVLPHEDVMPDVVTDRAGLMRAASANLEPLLLTYLGDDPAAGAAEVVERTAAGEPLLATTTEDGMQHRLWAVTDPADLAAVTGDLARRQALIADGHHRWATYLRLQEEHHGQRGGEQQGERPEGHRSPTPWDFGLVLLVDTARYPLQVRAIHRMLRRLPVADALASVGGHFRVRPVEGPLPLALEALADAAERGNAFLLAGDGTFHLVTDPELELLERTVRHDRPEAWRRLDATVLHATLLDALWQIPDTPDQITYIHDAAATVAMAERHGGTAVLLHPVREAVVRDLARQGVTMPRKSTSFGPKPATGLVLRSLD